MDAEELLEIFAFPVTEIAEERVDDGGDDDNNNDDEKIEEGFEAEE